MFASSAREWSLARGSCALACSRLVAFALTMPSVPCRPCNRSRVEPSRQSPAWCALRVAWHSHCAGHRVMREPASCMLVQGSHYMLSQAQCEWVSKHQILSLARTTSTLLWSQTDKHSVGRQGSPGIIRAVHYMNMAFVAAPLQHTGSKMIHQLHLRRSVTTTCCEEYQDTQSTTGSCVAAHSCTQPCTTTSRQNSTMTLPTTPHRVMPPASHPNPCCPTTRLAMKRRKPAATTSPAACRPVSRAEVRNPACTPNKQFIHTSGGLRLALQTNNHAHTNPHSRR